MSGPQQKDITLVLLGFIGSGKSATANTIVGEELFVTCIGQNRVTTKIKQSKISFNGLNITVVDTPGIEKAADVEKYILRSEAVYALVVQIGRFPSEDKTIVTEMFDQYFAVMKHVVIIFTHKKDMDTTPDPNTKTIQGWLKKVQTLENIIESKNIQYVAFENVDTDKEEKQIQVTELCDILKEIEFTGKSCPVSDTNDEFVILTRQQMIDEFGKHGELAFKDYISKQRQGLNSAPSSDEHGKSKHRKKKKC